MIVCCGEALIDCLPRKLADGEDAFQPVNGGSVYNTAIALGRLGHKVGLFAGMSSDFFGDNLRAGLKASLVSSQFLRTKPLHTTLAMVKLVDGHALYSFIDDASAGRMLVKADLPKLSRTVSTLHFGSISLIAEPCGSTYEALMKRAGLCHIYLVAPTTPEERMELIVKRGSGFIYYISREGVTGMQTSVASNLASQVAKIRAHTNLPVAVGFGVSNPEQASLVAQSADAVVVGSAIVNQIAAHGKSPELVAKVGEFVKTMTQAVGSLEQRVAKTINLV